LLEGYTDTSIEELEPDYSSVEMSQNFSFGPILSNVILEKQLQDAAAIPIVQKTAAGTQLYFCHCRRAEKDSATGNASSIFRVVRSVAGKDSAVTNVLPAKQDVSVCDCTDDVSTIIQQLITSSSLHS